MKKFLSSNSPSSKKILYIFYFDTSKFAKKIIFFMIIIVIIALPPYFLSNHLTQSEMIETDNINAAATLHYNSILVDSHCDTLDRILDANWIPAVDLGQETSLAVDIPKLREGGVNVQFFAACVPERFYPGQTRSRSLALINAFYYILANNQPSLGLAKSAKEIEKIITAGKIAGVLAIEGADFLKEPDGLRLLNQYYDLGVRVLGFSWQDSNHLVEGYSGKYYNHQPSATGLTAFGKNIVREMNRLGILIDVSHLPYNSFWDIINETNAPVIASHSGAQSLRNHFRNLSDDQILAIAEKGGVVQVVFHAPFLAYPGEEVIVATIVDHIDYMVKLTGVDHVGIGSDFDGGLMPPDMLNSSMLPNLTYELLERGYSPIEIKKILGGNTLRLLNQVWEGNSFDELPDKTLLDNSKPGNIELVPLTPSTMGELFGSPIPELVVKVVANSQLNIKNLSFQINIDGKIYPHQFNITSNTLSAIITEPLTPGFHVITFMVAWTSELPTKQTLIFHVSN